MKSRLLVKGSAYETFNGEVEISGAKNAALPAIAAALLTYEPVRLSSVPRLVDISSMITLLASIGANINFGMDHALEIRAENLSPKAPSDWVKKIRASILLLGPMLARKGEVELAMPGGCAIGVRPIMEHLSGLKALGAEIDITGNKIYAKTNGLKGTYIKMDSVSVGATENLIMAASLAHGETIIENAACEPEVTDLINLLCSMGAKIIGGGTDKIYINGVGSLHSTNYKIMQDRIEAGTFLIAATAARGRVKLKNYDASEIELLVNYLRQTGAEVKQDATDLILNMSGNRPDSVSIETAVYPGFPTDLQAQWVSLAAVSSGSCVIKENIFDDRLHHISELVSMGANIIKSGNTISVTGVETLKSNVVFGSDLRATAGLVIAANVATGTSEILNGHYVDRGYESFDHKLAQCGVFIKRLLEPDFEQAV